MSVLISPSMCSSLCILKATSSDVVMVQMMIGRDCFPVCSTTFKFSPKPSSTTAACRIFLEVKPMPGLQTVPGVHSKGNDHSQEDGENRPANDRHQLAQQP